MALRDVQVSFHNPVVVLVLAAAATVVANAVSPSIVLCIWAGCYCAHAFLPIAFRYAYLPSFHGFQSFYRFYGGVQDHFSHDRVINEKRYVYDMRYDKKEFCGKGCSKIVDDHGKYSSFVFGQESMNLINNYTAGGGEGPLFL